MDKSRSFYVIDSEGNEIEMEIIFTFSENGKNYVVFFDPHDTSEEIDIQVSCYDDNGNLFPVETDEEMELISEVIDSFFEENGDKAF